MIKIDIDYNDELLQRRIRRFPALMNRAMNSALSSVGFWIRGELRKYVETGVKGPPLHPFTSGLVQKKTSAGKAVIARRSRPHRGPLHWMGKFSRYAVCGSGEESVLIVGFGRSRGRRGKTPGEKLTSREAVNDPLLTMYARKHEYGRRIHVTDAMRRLWGMAGYPLKKTTSYVTIPRRSTISVIRREVTPQVQKRFKEKFIERLRKYQLEAE